MGQTTSQLFCRSNRRTIDLSQTDNEIDGYDVESQRPPIRTTTTRPTNHHHHHTTMRSGDDPNLDDDQSVIQCECTSQLPTYSREDIEMSYADLVKAKRIGTDIEIKFKGIQPEIHIWITGPLRCNTILIIDPTTRNAILIDPGGSSYQDVSCRKKFKAISLVEKIKEMNVEVVKIIITHAHFDHFLGLGAFREQDAFPDAEVWVHIKEKIPWLFLPMQLSMMRMKISKEAINAIGTPHKYFINAGGENEPLGFLDGEVIHTPGHSEGSICILFPSINLLISGDTLFRGAVGRSDLNGGSLRDIKRSILLKLYTLPNHTNVIPGHGPKTMIGYEKGTNPQIKVGDEVPV